jgi:hypothetical protein
LCNIKTTLDIAKSLRNLQQSSSLLEHRVGLLPALASGDTNGHVGADAGVAAVEMVDTLGAASQVF